MKTKAKKTPPLFASEAQERAFWESHDSTEYLDWSAASQVVLPNLKPTTKTIFHCAYQRICLTTSRRSPMPGMFRTNR